LKPSALYALAFERWQTVTRDSQHFHGWYGRLDDRMFMGLSTGGALETGVSTSHSYGMPLIPGSSVKGVARARALQLGVSAEYRAVLFGEDEDEAHDSGRLAGAGSLVWHDAWWCPDPQCPPFTEEVVTVHHQSYYRSEGEATDFDSPVPNGQIAVQGSFYFVIEGDPVWTVRAMELLRQALAAAGIGAKRAAGYGAMNENAQLVRKDGEARQALLRQDMGPEERVRDYLAGLDAKQLAERFGPDLKKTLERFSADEQALLPSVGQEIHATLLEEWTGETKKTNKARFKARRYFMGQGNDD
jgi:CRISPR-associated protein Cmr6